MKLLVAFLSLLFIGCRALPEGAAADPAPRPHDAGRTVLAAGSPKLAQVRTAIVCVADAPLALVVAPGRVQINPNRISRVSLPVPGRIAAVEVRLGDSVVPGQPLLRIESPEVEAATSDCVRAEAGQTQARAALNKTHADLERLRDLYAHGAAPQKDVLQGEAEVARVESDVQAAGAAAEQSRRRLTILGLKACEFGQQVVVRAPIAGKILDINAVPGEYRNDTSAPLMTIADLRSVWVTSGVPESSIRLIQPGERVSIELAAYPGETFQGRVMRVADVVDPVTRSVEVQTELENPAGRFRPEMFATMRHSHGSISRPVVPSSALVESQGRTWVFVLTAPGEFKKTAVETGEDIGPNVPVLSGLKRGDRVVVDGAILLQERAGGGY